MTSPLRRARETAAAFGRPVTVDARWIELDYGELEGLPAAGHRDSIAASWEADPAWAPPGGESLASVSTRVREACEELLPRLADESVVVVSHVFPIKVALLWALGCQDEATSRLHLDVASLSRVDAGPHGPVLYSVNERRYRTPG
ncbi:MAG: phosphoglycerate mutase family protein [Acidimicrobiaceae bacterium]|nr:phosphoglycerate mutase family protein [Acidimicrobiaceae bacterium]